MNHPQADKLARDMISVLPRQKADTKFGEGTIGRTNGAASLIGAPSAAVARALREPVSLPDLFRARRVMIDMITITLHAAGKLDSDPLLRRRYFGLALHASEVLDALEANLTERTRR